MLISDPSHPVYFRIAPAILLPLGVLFANFGWTPPDSVYVGDLTTWVIFAFLLGIAMWHQDRINQSYSSHWMFLPFIGLYNGMTFGLAMVLVLAGSTSPDGAIVIFFVTGTLWGLFVMQKVSMVQVGLPLDDSKLAKTLFHMAMICFVFVVTASGILSAGLGGALGFQFFVMLPIYKGMNIDHREERFRKWMFNGGALILIAYEFFV